MEDTILRRRRRGFRPAGKVMLWLSTLLRTDLAAFTKMVGLIVDQGSFDGRLGDREHMLKVFTAHIEEVKAVIPPERLLVFEVAQGWEPLCRFLDVAVPDEPFPRVNDKAEFRENARRTFTAMLWRRSRPV